MIRLIPTNTTMSARSGPSIARYLVAWAALAGVVAVASYMWVDHPLARYFYDIQDDGLQPLFYAISSAGKSGRIIAVVVLVALISYAVRFTSLPVGVQDAARHIQRISLFILVSLVASGLLVHLLKMGFGRWRPSISVEFGIQGFSWFTVLHDAKSFPSGHTQNAFALASALWLVLPRFGVAYFAAAALISVSRVFLFEHYVSDVVVGAYIGFAVPVLLHGYISTFRMVGPWRMSWRTA